MIDDVHRSMKDCLTFDDVLSLAKRGIPPDEPDPIKGETADEAYERFKNGEPKNPFHADTIELRAARDPDVEDRPELDDRSRTTDL